MIILCYYYIMCMTAYDDREQQVIISDNNSVQRIHHKIVNSYFSKGLKSPTDIVYPRVGQCISKCPRV